jgi:uroporphyrinogen-III synthase
LTAPLQGLRVLVTRAKHQNETISSRLREMGADPIEVPLIDIVPPEDPGPLQKALAGDYDWVVFTSTNAVQSVFDRARSINTVKIAAVGPGTARALTSRGFTADCVPDHYSAAGIVDALGNVNGRRILLPRGDIADDALPDQLRARGAVVIEVVSYRTLPSATDAEDLRRIMRRRIDVVTFFSPSAVKSFASISDRELLSGLLVACIGPTTAEAAAQLGIRVDVVAEQHTGDGLVEAIARRVGAPA